MMGRKVIPHLKRLGLSVAVQGAWLAADGQ
jgi:hypothetical protein